MKYDNVDDALAFFCSEYQLDENQFQKSDNKESYILDILDNATICEIYEDIDLEFLINEVMALINLLENNSFKF